MFHARPASLVLTISLSVVAGLGCTDPVTEGPRATSLPDPVGVEPGDPEVLRLEAAAAVGLDRFVTSTGCALCHSNTSAATAMRDEADREIGPFNLWQSTMMANAARDPLWRAMVSAEVARTPSARVAIESKCMRCHAPAGHEAATAAGNTPSLVDLQGTSALARTGTDGVMCAVCHQVLPDNFNDDSSFSGGYVLGSERKIFGPHQRPATAPMQNHVNYTPTFSAHMLRPGLCATCHTLETHALREDGSDVGGAPFVEQATFLEWQNSIYAGGDGEGTDGFSCQACHMPTTSVDNAIIQTRIARSPPGGDFNIEPRQPFGRHELAGANTFMPAVFKAERSILNPQATNAAFDATIAAATHRLQNLTATVEIGDIDVDDDGTVAFDVTLFSDVGHKFPTGFPARRAWLRVRIFGEDDALLFSSGEFNKRGRILDDLGDLLDVEKAGAPFEPHHAVITRSDEVQIYEQVMGDENGDFTPSLLRATKQLKDNRILPRGYVAGRFSASRTAPIGVDGDDDFAAGTDVVRYAIPLKDKQVVRVEATLYYQSVGGRFLTDLFQVDTPEVRALRTMIERADPRPVAVASAAREP